MDPLQWADLHWTPQNSLESLDNGQESLKGLATNGHGNMLAIEENAVFIEVGIRGILETPIMTVHVKANDPVIGPGWMV